MIAASLRFAAAVLAALALASPAAAGAAEDWQATTKFELDPWQVPGSSPGAVSAKYQLLGPTGAPVGSVIERPANELIRYLEVPPVPGAYRLEAWLEDAGGVELHRAGANLRFDDVAPPAPAPQAPSAWIPGGEPVVLEVGRPTGPLPVSGLRGYAVSLDRGSGGHPCASPSLCSPAETDLAGGIGDDSLSLGLLAEGTTYARVVAVSGAGVPSPIRTATFRVDATPPSLSLAGIPSGWSNGPIRIAALAQDPLSGMAAAGPAGPYTAVSVDGGAPAAAPGDTAVAWVSGSGTHAVHPFARDAAGNLTGSDEATVPPAATAVVRIDEDPPQVAFAAAQDPADPERIEALVADDLSGASQSRGSIAVRLAGTRARFEELATRVNAGRLVARWDSDSYPPGKYEFLATGFDAAGNAGTGTDRAHGGRMVLVNPLKTPVALTAKLAEGRLGGRLRRVGGGAVTGRRIAVVETFAVGAEPQRRTSFRTTDANGAFSKRLPPGPSRDVVAYFAGTPTLTRTSSATAHLASASAIRLRASTATARVGGRPVVFSGAVAHRGARGAVEGLPVELQFRYPGAGWRGFRTVEADRRGRFRYAYRFSDDDSRGVRFRFRAHVKGREGWPYEPGTSRPVTVTGR